MPRFDPDRFRALLEEGGGAGPVRRSKTTWLFACPMCGTHACKMYAATGFFTCFFCRHVNGMHGPADLYLAKALGIPQREAHVRLYGASGTPLRLRLPAPVFTVPEEDEQELPPARPWDYHHYPIDHAFAERGAEYLAGRGISVEIAKQYGIRYSPPERRVYFPITWRGEQIGWQGRLVIPDWWIDPETGKKRYGIKAMTDLPPGWRDRLLMFQDRLVPGGHAVLGEGPVGTIKAHLCGGNVASMGKVVSQAQIQILKDEGIKTLYLALDDDAPAETMRVVRQVAGWMDTRRIAVLPDRDDTGEMSFEEVYEAFRTARPIRPWSVLYFFGKPPVRRTA